MLHSDEVMWLGHRLRALAEIFFEKFAEQFPFAAAEQGPRLHCQFKAPFAQSPIGGFGQPVTLRAGLQLLLEQIGLVGKGPLQQIPEKDARLLGIAGLVIVEGDDG